MKKPMCKLCGREHNNEFSWYCSKICENKAEATQSSNAEIPLQKTELVPRPENMLNESVNTDLSRQESNGKGEPNINVNIFHKESEFAPYLKDEPNFGFALLGFLFPYAGLIVYFIIKEEKPLKAGSCIKGVIWSVVLTVIFGIMYFAWLDKQYEKIDKQYKIEMQKIDKEYEKFEKGLKKELNERLRKAEIEEARRQYQTELKQYQLYKEMDLKPTRGNAEYKTPPAKKRNR